MLNINIFSKFGEDRMDTDGLREWTLLVLWLDSSKAQKKSCFIQRSLAGLFKSPKEITFYSKKPSVQGL